MSSTAHTEAVVDFSGEMSHFPQDDYIVVAIVDGLVDVSLVHRPAPERSWTSGFGRVQIESFDSRMEGMSIPVAWPSACGVVERGSVYNYAGSFAGVSMCPDCAAVLAGEKSPFTPGRGGRPLSAAAREVLALADQYGEVTSGLVASSRDMTRSSANKQLSRLVERGALVRVGWGRYALAPEGAA